MELFETQVRDVVILPREIKLCVENAGRAMIGGKSNIREEDERTKSIAMDQLIGQLGEFALSIYLTGNTTAYKIQRRAANNHPEYGDNGEDIFGLNIDVKTSAMRNSNNPLDYTLAVRPKEIHGKWCYVLALVHPNGRNGLSMVMPIRVRLVGWLTTEELPTAEDRHGTFKGAYTVRAINLHPLPNFRWFWRS